MSATPADAATPAAAASVPQAGTPGEPDQHLPTQPQAGAVPTPETPQAGEAEAISLDEAKKLRREAQSLRGRLKDFEEAEEKRKHAAMTEAERLAAERDAALATIAAANERVIRAEVRAQALALGFADVDDAWALIDRAAVTLDDGGDVRGAKEAVKALAAKKPHLIRADTGGGYGAPAGSRSNSAPPDARQQTRANLSRLLSGRRAS